MNTNTDMSNSQGNWEPGLSKQSFKCPRCGSFAQQTWYTALLESQDGINTYSEQAVDEELTFENASRSAISRPNKTQWRFSKCLACRKKSAWRGSNLVFPNSTPIPLGSTDLPIEVATLYEEARQVYTVSKRASAALARAALEVLLLELVPQVNGKNTLYELIERAEVLLSSDTCQILTIIRKLGNKVLHPDDKNPEIVALYLSEEATDMAELIFNTINRVVDELITKPRVTKELLSKLSKPEN